MIGGTFPVWALVLILSIMVAAVVFFTSKNEVQPKYHNVSTCTQNVVVCCIQLCGSAWSLVFFIPATTANDLRLRRISIQD